MNTKDPTILLVDDDIQNVELIQHVLAKNFLAHRLEVFRDGAEVFEHFYQQDGSVNTGFFDEVKVVLLDLKMPRVTGLEVLKRLKNNAETHMIPVVILSSSRERNDVQESYRLGANSYIVKPVEFQKFKDTVRATIQYWLHMNHSVE